MDGQLDGNKQERAPCVSYFSSGVHLPTKELREVMRKKTNNARERMRVKSMNIEYKRLEKLTRRFVPMEKQPTRLQILKSTIESIFTLERKVLKNILLHSLTNIHFSCRLFSGRRGRGNAKSAKRLQTPALLRGHKRSESRVRAPPCHPSFPTALRQKTSTLQAITIFRFRTAHNTTHVADLRFIFFMFFRGRVSCHKCTNKKNIKKKHKSEKTKNKEPY